MKSLRWMLPSPSGLYLQLFCFITFCALLVSTDTHKAVLKILLVPYAFIGGLTLSFRLLCGAYRSLEVLNLSRGTLSDGFFYALAGECSSLLNLSISDATLGSGGAQEIILRHESLRRLHIFRCRVLRISIR